MRRLLLIALLSAVALSPLSMEAQGRRSSHRGIAAGLPAVVVVTPPDPFYQPFSWTAPIGPAPVYAAPIYLAPQYGAAPYGAQRHVPVWQPIPSISSQADALSIEVKRLRQELARLREEHQARYERPASPEPAPPVEATFLPTILVFLDGRQMEVQNYAIVNRTLWSFTEQGSTKIPVADLDVEATRRLNADRGVRFPLPR